MAFLKRFHRAKQRKLAIIGLDCADPELLFERWASDLPTITGLRQQGLYGSLESVIPAITVPAWACMTSGKDPGQLGIYGFRNRSSYDYNNYAIASARAVNVPRIWDILGNRDKRSIIIGVPPSYPIKAINGQMIADFLAPPQSTDYTYPPELRALVEQEVGQYEFDVQGFRTDKKDWLLEQIYSMTRKRFKVARKLVKAEAWDFFMMVEMGVDRIHHGFWKDMDEKHPHHDPSSPYRNAIYDYYRYLDREIAALLNCFDDDTAVMIVSDHGAKAMMGGICINEWLIQEGYLVLKQPVNQPTPFSKVEIDWSKTRVWGEGGYYGRLFFNVVGREPQGIVQPQDINTLKAELSQKLMALGDEDGDPIGTRCFIPEEIYQDVRGIAPDLMVYFGDLAWRSIGSVGHGKIHVHENDTGPDDANHAQLGIFIYYDPKQPHQGQCLTGLHLQQIAPTVLKYFNIDIPEDMPKAPINALWA